MNTKLVSWLILLFYVLTPVIFLILPAGYFDEGESICPSKRFFDIECLGCGMTRAVMHLIHFDFDSALYYNSLSFAVAPTLAILWLKWTWDAWKKVKLASIEKFDV